MGLLAIREKMKGIYGEYSAFLDPLFRFVMVFVTLLTMSTRMGYMRILNNILVILLLSVVLAILPRGMRVFLISCCLMANMYQVSYEALGVCALLLLLMFVMYYIFQPGDGDLLFLIPLLFTWKLPYLVPIVLGLTGTLISVIPTAFGIILFFYMKWVVENVSLLSSASTLQPLQKLTQIVNGLLKNEEMYVYIAAFALTICVVYLIRRLSMKYSWVAAIIAGSVVNLMVLVGGMGARDVKFSMLTVLIGVLIGAIIGFILEYFLFLVDYSRTVTTQFEDDEYYYYVKAVPKFAIPSESISVKNISASASRKDGGNVPRRRKPQEGERSGKAAVSGKKRQDAEGGAKTRRARAESIRDERTEGRGTARSAEEEREINAALEASLRESRAAARRAAAQQNGEEAATRTRSSADKRAMLARRRSSQND